MRTITSGSGKSQWKSALGDTAVDDLITLRCWRESGGSMNEHDGEGAAPEPSGDVQPAPEGVPPMSTSHAGEHADDGGLGGGHASPSEVAAPEPPGGRDPPTDSPTDEAASDRELTPSADDASTSTTVSTDAGQDDLSNVAQDASERASAASSVEPSPSVTPLPDHASSTPTVIMTPKPSDDAPDVPPVGKISGSAPKKIFALGDLHGWAPGLITYLVTNRLATIAIDGLALDDGAGTLNTDALHEVFPDPVALHQRGRLPRAGLGGQPGHSAEGMNGPGHVQVRARWIGAEGDVFVQVGDIFDRADHSELAAEILRQLVIDAPLRVFVLVGNHEQFLLEDDFQNWFHNEARNARMQDHRTDASSLNGEHTRFLMANGFDPEERARATFRRYVDAAWALYLTQAAVLQDTLGLFRKHDLNRLLEPGWAAYEAASSLRANYVSKGALVPGAIVAMSVADHLFHHAEPAAHASGSADVFEASLNDITTQFNVPVRARWYSHGGGSIQGTPDSEFLWARGSSNGATSGNPKAAQDLSQLVMKFPGLRRVVHGHTPTVGLSEFQAHLGGRSSTLSYLGETMGTTHLRGKANGVRVLNLDEGMSPVYYLGSQGSYDPTRIPTGMRMEVEELSRFAIANNTHPPVQLVNGSNLSNDIRLLWKWKASELRELMGAGLHGLVHGDVEHRVTVEYVNEDDQRNHARRVSGHSIGQAFVDALLHEVGWVSDAPRIEIPDAVPGIKELKAGRGIDEWRKVPARITAVRFNQEGTHEVMLVNTTSSEHTWRLFRNGSEDHNLVVKALQACRFQCAVPNDVVCFGYGEDLERIIEVWEASSKVPHELEHSFAIAMKQSVAGSKAKFECSLLHSTDLRPPPPPAPSPAPSQHNATPPSGYLPTKNSMGTGRDLPQPQRTGHSGDHSNWPQDSAKGGLSAQASNAAPSSTGGGLAAQAQASASASPDSKGLASSGGPNHLHVQGSQQRQRSQSGASTTPSGGSQSPTSSPPPLHEQAAGQQKKTTLSPTGPKSQTGSDHSPATSSPSSSQNPSGTSKKALPNKGATEPNAPKRQTKNNSNDAEDVPPEIRYLKAKFPSGEWTKVARTPVLDALQAGSDEDLIGFGILSIELLVKWNRYSPSHVALKFILAGDKEIHSKIEVFALKSMFSKLDGFGFHKGPAPRAGFRSDPDDTPNTYPQAKAVSKLLFGNNEQIFIEVMRGIDPKWVHPSLPRPNIENNS